MNGQTLLSLPPPASFPTLRLFLIRLMQAAVRFESTQTHTHRE